MNLRLHAGTLFLFLVIFCSATFSATPAKTYQVHGLLRSFDPTTKEAAISHEEIPGYMAAMTMKFRVAKELEMRNLRPGDSLSFALHVTTRDAWIDDVKKEGSAARFPFPVDTPTSTSELKEGDHWPDAELLDEKGETIHLHDFRGQPLAITFIYLGCPLPTYCPLMNRNLQNAEALIRRLNYDGKMKLLSLSMDATHDTPERLAAVAAGYEAKLPLWTFASVSEKQLRPLAAAAGIQFSEVNGQIVHNLRTIVLDGDGRVRRILRGNSWTPQELVAELRAALTEFHQRPEGAGTL